MKTKCLLLFALLITVYGGIVACAGSDSDAVYDSEISENINNDTGKNIMNANDANEKRIVIENNEFTVGGKKIWINGANTPWNKWNEFGGGYDDSWWDEHFSALHENGVNGVRVWINCNNDNGAVIINDAGMVSGVSDKHWADLDKFFATAERTGIYIMATLLSFDHFKSNSAQKWRNMLVSDETADSFAENYVVPFVNRYKHNPYLWSIDLCNEPDWVFENPECGNVLWEQISNLFARAAAAIHENSDILVTVGLSFPKYNSDGPGSGYQGNKISDAFLQNLYDNPNAYLDFWSPHYYDWVGQWYGVPFYSAPSGARPNGWGLDGSKPALIGECRAKGSSGQTAGTKNNTLITDYENAYLNGWQGVMAWTSNGVDGNGGFDDLIPATNYMLEKYGDVIFP